MDRDTAVTLIQQRVKRASDSSLAAIIISEMQLVQETELEGGPILPWFLLSENLTASTTADEERVQLPENVASVAGKDFLREYEDGALWVYDSDDQEYKALRKDDYETILQKYPGNGQPKVYALDGEYFRLRPRPDIVYTLRIKCYLRDAILSTNVENLWLKHASDLMVAKTAAKVARYHLRDEKAAVGFDRDAGVAYSRLNVQHIARQQANFEATMGDL